MKFFEHFKIPIYNLIFFKENYTIPSGSDIIILAAKIQRSECYWGDRANEFYPEHFLPENVAKRHRCTFLPYGYGIRNCMAAKYADYSMKIYVVHLIKKFKLTTSLKLDDIKFSSGVILNVTNGNMVKLKRRR